MPKWSPEVGKQDPNNTWEKAGKTPVTSRSRQEGLGNLGKWSSIIQKQWVTSGSRETRPEQPPQVGRKDQVTYRSDWSTSKNYEQPHQETDKQGPSHLQRQEGRLNQTQEVRSNLCDWNHCQKSTLRCKHVSLPPERVITRESSPTVHIRGKDG